MVEEEKPKRFFSKFKTIYQASLLIVLSHPGRTENLALENSTGLEETSLNRSPVEFSSVQRFNSADEQGSLTEIKVLEVELMYPDNVTENPPTPDQTD